MPEGAIEGAAMALLGRCARQFGQTDTATIPVDMIVESGLDLTLEIDDLAKRLGGRDILGATWIESRTVAVDQSLDPELHPGREGRFNFTLAHEAGHWVLHAHQIAEVPKQGSLFDVSQSPSIVCRSGARKERIEWQADRFASYLLMPGGRVMSAWKDLRGTAAPYMAAEEIEAIQLQSDFSIPVTGAAKTLAKCFRVSGQAMQIRLEGMGLIQTQRPEPDLLSGLGA